MEPATIPRRQPAAREHDHRLAKHPTLALRVIRLRRSAHAWKIPIPPPPPGKSFDRDKVNVSVSTGEGATQLLYDPTCAGVGWRYDDETAPTQIVLCPATCENAKSDPSTQVDFAFGCATRSGPN